MNVLKPCPSLEYSTRDATISNGSVPRRNCRRLANFLIWLNGLTWTSEWDKFGVVDAAGAAVPKPAPPRTGIVA
jgi:hypothetical protein